MRLSPALVLLMVVVLYSGTALHRNAVWRTDVGIWEDAVKKSPRKARAFYSLGCTYARAARFVEALAMFGAAIVLDPHYYDAYQKRGNAFDDLGQPEQAFEEYSKVIKLAPDFADVYYDRGLAYERLMRFGEARADYQRGCELGDGLSCAGFRKLSKMK